MAESISVVRARLIRLIKYTEVLFLEDGRKYDPLLAGEAKLLSTLQLTERLHGNIRILAFRDTADVVYEH